MSEHHFTESAPIDTSHKLEVSIAQTSIKGLKHQNEDAVGYKVPEDSLLAIKGVVAVIADGVSSAEAGKEASAQCVKDFIEDFFRTPDLWSTKNSAQRILTALNRSLYLRSHKFVNLERGYITTLCILVIKSSRAHLFHIGDSRIYLIRDNEMEQLTNDHLKAPSGEGKPYLVRAMGMDVGLQIDYRCVDIKEGDRFFMSTDGVHDFVDDEEILNTLNQYGENYQQAGDALADVALKNKSNDNISCLMLSVDKIPHESTIEAGARLSKLPFPPDLEPGMKLDGYRIDSLLFASARSQLYQVTDLENSQPLVMKTPSVNYCDDPGYIEGFLTEAWVGERVSSPHIVKVIPHHPQRNFLYYLMEDINGVTLEQWMEYNSQPRPRQVIDIVKQIADGLHALHKKETVHQDLKPGNIMITPEGVVKIIDLGSVFVAGIAEIDDPVRRSAVLGTVNYTDPLYMQGKKPGIKGDIYSLGSIAYEMITGKLPYGDKLENFSAHLDTKKLKYISSFKVNKQIPIWFDGALRTATSLNLETRYSSVEALIKDLETPNPAFLTEDYQGSIKGKDKILKPPFPLWKLLAVLWCVSILLALVIFLD